MPWPTGLTDYADAKEAADKEEASRRQLAPLPEKIQVEEGQTFGYLLKREVRALNQKVKSSARRQNGTYYKHICTCFRNVLHKKCSEVKESHFDDFVHYLTTHPDIVRSRGKYGKKCAELLKGLIEFGLSPTGVEKLRKMKHFNAHKASGKPFTGHQIRVIFSILPDFDDYYRGIVLFGCSGAPHIIDVVLAQWSHWDSQLGKIAFERGKSGGQVEFFVLDELADWLSARRKTIPQECPYIFPELVYGHNYYKRSDYFNIKIDRDAASEGLGTRATARFSKLLKVAGIKEDGLSFKSFRQRLASFCESVGIKRGTIMRILGHSREESTLRYVFPSENDLCRAKELMQRNLNSVLAHTEEFFPTTLIEIHDALKESEKRIREDIQKVGHTADRIETLVQPENLKQAVISAMDSPEVEERLFRRFLAFFEAKQERAA